MRLSVNKEDPGYHQSAHMYCIYVNGIELKDCETVDTDEQMIVIFPRNKNGYLYSRNGVIVRRIVYLPGRKIEIRNHGC